MIVDLHVHTRLSADSNADPAAYLEAVVRAGRPLGAIGFAEHRLYPTDPAIDRRYAELSDQFGILIFKGVEADADLGHLLMFGVTGELLRRFDLRRNLLKSEGLSEVVHGEGGIAIPAHPLRDSGFGARLEDLIAKLGSALSAIEAVNGQNTRRQNDLALGAAEKLGLTALGGSDAHYANSGWFLNCATELERQVTTVEELCAELRAGRARPYLFDRQGAG